MQKYCYACTEGRLTCIMDYKSEKKREFEKKFCNHLSQGKDKESCNFYLTVRRK